MATTNNDAVQQLYVAYFNRPADGAGLDYWTNVLTSGGATIDQISAQFATSAEYKATYAGLNNDQIVDTVYLNLFGRHADIGGLQYWSAKLSEGVLTLSNVVTAVSGSALAAGSGSDYSAIFDKIQAADAFTDAVQQNAAARIAYSTTGGTAVGKQYLAGVIDDTSAQTALTNLPATLNQVINGGTSVLTVNLTTGIDSQSGNVFNGVIDTVTATNSTFNSFDKITGTAGTSANVLNLVSNGAFASPGAVTVSNIQTANVTALGGVTLNSSSWSGLTALNVVASTGADAITASGTTVITVADTLATSAAAPTATTINGGAAVNLTATAATTGANVAVGAITIGGSTAATGAVIVNSTKTLTGGGAIVEGSINVNGGAAVTINTTNNVVTAVATPGTVVVSGAVGAVAVNTTDDFTVNGTSQAITVNAGSSVVVNEVLKSTASATGTVAGIVAATSGAVNVNGDATTTSVTITQSAAVTGSAYVAGTPATAGGVITTPAVPAAPGLDATPAVVTSATAAVAATAGVLTVVDGAVTIIDANNATTSTASNTIKSVTLTNYGAGSAITSNALTTLTLSGTAGTLAINNVAAGANLTNTTLALNLNGLKGIDTITDTHNEIVTLNVVTGGTASSSLSGFADTGLKTLNVSGSQVFNLSTVPASLTKIVVSGAAGFSGDVSALSASLAFTTTSSGVITTTLAAGTQTFVGSTGQDVVSIGADALVAITGGSAANNELILLGNSALFTAANTGANVTHFTTLGVNDTAANVDVYDMRGTFSGYKALEVIGASTVSDSFINVAAGTTLAIDNAATSVAYTLAVPSSTATVNVTLGTAGNATPHTVGALSLNDVNGDGVATVNLASNDKTAGDVNTITTLTDVALSTLNLTGNAGLNIGTLTLGNPGQTPAVGVASFSVTNNTTGLAGSIIGTLNDDTLGSLNFAGSNATAITALNDHASSLFIANTGAQGAAITTLTDALLTNLSFSGTAGVAIATLTDANVGAITLANTGTGTDVIKAWTSASTSLSITGNVGLGQNSLAGGSGVTFSSTAGVTISAASDHAHLNLQLTGAASGNTDTITVGNDNDRIIDASTAGTVKVTVGTGSNLIDLHTGGAAGYSATVTLGAHAAPDSILVGTVLANAAAANVVISGAAAGDIITFTDANTLTINQVTAAQQATIATSNTIGQAIAAAEALTPAAHSATVFQFGGNTYVIEAGTAGNGTTTQAGDAVIELVGVHTLSATATAGVVHLAS